MNIYRFLRQDWLALLFLLTPIALATYLWPQLPDQVAVHWNVVGKVNDWDSKETFGLMMGGLTVFTYLLLLCVPFIDPKANAERNRKPLIIIRTAIMGLLCVTMSAIMLYNVGVAINMPTLVKVVVPLLLLVIGNLLSKLKPSYFVGIRTPWTLESPVVWTKTHRLAGGLWVASALFLLMVSLYLPESYYLPVLIGVLLVMTLAPIGYSYLIFQEQQTTH